MGGVGSAAAILLATDLTGGSGLAGLEPVCFHRHESREKGGELPVTPLANCVVVDLLAPSTGNSNSLGSVKCKSKGIETQELDSSSAANRSSSISDHGAGGMRLTGSGELPLPIPRSGSGPAELDTFSTADALLNHLYTSGRLYERLVISVYF